MAAFCQLSTHTVPPWAGDNFFVTDGQKRDYLSHASQRARGTTNRKQLFTHNSDGSKTAKVIQR